MPASALAFDAVTKRFGDFTAVDALSFAVPEGSVFGFLGGNGAGKTTSLRMALDILTPTSGSIVVLGQPPSRENAAAIGFLPEERGLYKKMSVLDTIVYFGRLKRMEAGAAKAAAMALLERLELADRAKSPIEKLSKGMAQKVQVATALVNSPRLLMLDEPFSGLDPVNQAMLEDLIAEAAKGGATVIFSTHVMQHAERLCDRLLLLARGRKAFEGTLDEARGALPSRLVLAARMDPAGLPGVARARRLSGEGEWQEYEVELADGAPPEALLAHCTANGVALNRFDVHRPSLHEAFIHFVGADPATTRQETVR
ncbi:ATP-binding cassette domain-containing protein [Erythrobacter arachoides]|uniref:ATP-binding cassette domain-containing protein n=1 Tax=Aurantiacibacter arachoides TaxID=1850444 RepID=A0A845A4X6_9SPHN|nr:ATP-binding cassette domain-containing protein [Aurantiacibacter arachoides]MXO94472.1 ATP-binding cassette domain-containing protein [Aurantiacibacter arachoides]GGD63177.1 ABC transporter ATP-binding protein [Aurantiacibacter arachoides]